MTVFEVCPVGYFSTEEGESVIKLEKKYLSCLQGLEGFSHIQVLWWLDRLDAKEFRENLTEEKPYKKGPDVLGVFATRSPMRPNPIALTAVNVTWIEYEKGVIHLAYADAMDGTPVLDIKPYTPSVDRVEHPSVPAWCANWPCCNEDSGEFDWSEVFNF